MYDNVSVIIPSLNPDEKLMKVVDGLVEAGFTSIILVNDGSDENHKKPFEDALKYKQCVVLTHEVNKGKGRGLKTAFTYVRKNIPSSVGVITVDGDNQHQVKDIIACMNKMFELKDHVILGCRDFSGDDVPARSKFGNNATRRVFKYLCGLNISDTQTGLRAIPAMYLDDFIKLKGERFEYETNMLLEFKEIGIPYTEVKISTVYIEENATSHFNPLVDSVKIYGKIFKFLLSSLSSCIIDLAMFSLFAFVLKDGISDGETRAWVVTFIARAISSIYNYLVNRRAVFKSTSPVKVTIVKYYVLCVLQATASAALLAGATTLFGLEGGALTVVVKAIIDSCLFLASFPIQRKWVYNK